MSADFVDGVNERVEVGMYATKQKSIVYRGSVVGKDRSAVGREFEGGIVEEAA